ncbi:MAG: ribokinase [Verrucomicrobiota bacterium]
MNSAAPAIFVVGSLNLDHNYLVQRIPVAGETVASGGVVRHFGGKGANQAVAAQAAGGQVTLLGAVGDDDDGRGYLERLASKGVNTRAIKSCWRQPTGSAVILSEASGENLIVVEAGANSEVTPEFVDGHRRKLEQADVLLMQLECPLPAVRRAAEIAREAGAIVMINPSPWHSGFLMQEVPCDWLIVNQTEAEAAGKRLESLAENIVITQGSSPTLVRSGSEPEQVVPTFDVEPVDTVGAGDAFAGALAVAIGEGLAPLEAIRFANGAGALATSALGAQKAIPSREKILSFIN